MEAINDLMANLTSEELAEVELPEASPPAPGDQALKPWQPKKFNDRHRQMIVCSAIGMKNVEIAKAFNMSQSRVSIILTDPRAKLLKAEISADFISEITRDAGQMITGSAVEAVEKIQYLLRNSENERVQLNAAQDLLDRGGHKAKEVRENHNINVDGEGVSTLIETLAQLREQPEELVHIQDSSGVFRAQRQVTSGVK